MSRIRFIVVALLPVALAACTSNWDMYGHDPKDFYKKHPIENRVETRNETHTVRFPQGADRLSGNNIASVRSDLRGISPMAVESAAS